MTFRISVLALALIASLTTAGNSHACTTMLLGARGHTRLAYSHDFVTSAGALLVNGRGAARHSVMAPESDAWPVEHASVTFNQFGPGLPTTGMNEAGLVVTLMCNDGVDHTAPTPEHR